MHSKNTDRHSHKEVGENKQSAKESPLPQASNFRGIQDVRLPRNTPKLAENFQRLKELEEIGYQESGESDQEEMPKLVEDRLDDLPKSISDLSKDEFIRMMMRESYHSHAEQSQKGDIRSEIHDSVVSKRSMGVSEKHQSNQSHINIISNSSSKNSASEKTLPFDPTQPPSKNKSLYKYQDQDLMQKLGFLDQSFSDELAPLQAQADQGLFNKFEESVDGVEDLIFDFKREFSLGPEKIQSNFKSSLKEKTNTDNKDPAAETIEYKIRSMRKEIKQGLKGSEQSEGLNDIILLQIHQEKHKLLQMVEDVLTLSERGKIDLAESSRILNKYESIKAKEQILQHCGVLKDHPKEKTINQISQN